MKKLITLLLATAFLFQSCENKREKTKEKSFLKEDNISIKTNEEKTDLPEEDGKYSIIVEQIDSLQYYLQKEKDDNQNIEIKKITDFKVARKLLVGIVEFDEKDIDYPMVKKINFINNRKPTHKSYFELDDCSFKAYFPNENILLCEGGHTTDVSFNLINGQETELTGNPDYIKTSPNKLFRINGHYDGQECSSYFIQKKTKNEFEKIIQLDTEFEKQTKKWLCIMGDNFWKDDTTFYLTLVTSYGKDRKNLGFFKIELFKK
ncbi:hypothetical protein J2X31_003600 [Flavobacterium arsenatis]|uniref:Lipoprotein n=1 Tax=Flavobacterium arsenatis TaxID=1484332 RepID=A0ABU1TUL9_9FLAO|nr:hypothetical protein [Flavobacterium arsenatis]MDR6969567.1 hypothetical protein [Flavobacterium arsenatis]